MTLPRILRKNDSGIWQESITGGRLTGRSGQAAAGWLKQRNPGGKLKAVARHVVNPHTADSGGRTGAFQHGIPVSYIDLLLKTMANAITLLSKVSSRDLDGYNFVRIL